MTIDLRTPPSAAYHSQGTYLVTTNKSRSETVPKTETLGAFFFSWRAFIELKDVLAGGD